KARCLFEIGTGLTEMGIIYHDFFSTPMLLNSSELMFETSRSAPARTTNKNKQIKTTTVNIGTSSLYI
ncbi:MAG TPA: hypothetical protein VI753_09530, partial [Anaerolineales bacterium]|nr:hypothetical protein [Anaerolineales bacterium]